MSGHSKWASIKRKKGAADAKRGQSFTKLANAIALAARDGGDPDLNFKLRLAIDRAKAANMPNANIDKSIARGTGQLKGSQIDEVIYEGYGPGGIAVIVQGATDNKNRALTDVRTAFSKNGGNMAEPGAVAFQFQQKGVIILKTEDPDTTTLNAIDAGAVDIDTEEDSVTVYTKANELNAVRTKLDEAGETIESADLSYVPSQTIPISEAETANKIIRLMDALEELDDVTTTFSNFDIPAEILESV